MPRRSKNFWRIEPRDRGARESQDARGEGRGPHASNDGWGRDIVGFFTVNWALKLTALVLAFLLWRVVKAEEPTRQVIHNVPVRIENRDAEWIMVAPPQPESVSVTVYGPWRELLRLGQPDIYVPLDDVGDSTQLVPLNPLWVRIFGSAASEVSVEAIRPQIVQLTFDRLSTTVLPVAVRVMGRPAPGFELARPVRAEPPLVRVSGPARSVASLDSVRLPPVDISRLSATDTLAVAIDTTGLGSIFVPQEVQVIVSIEPIEPDTVAGALDLLDPARRSAWPPRQRRIR